MTTLEIVHVTHEFTAENEDEISLHVGDRVTVLEKDEAYHDGWWRGRTDRGEIGLFPSNYTTARASLDKEIGSLHSAIATMTLQQKQQPQQQQNNDPTSIMPPPQDPLPALPTVSSASSESSSIGSRKVSRTMSVNKAQRQTTLKASLTLPTLRDVTPEDWTVDQVVTWLGAMGFHDVATIFRVQEISGDILMELTVDSLKELNIGTFGKRFKLHNAIQGLKEETSVHLPQMNAAEISRPSMTESRPISMTSGSSGSAASDTLGQKPRAVYNTGNNHPHPLNMSPSMSAPLFDRPTPHFKPKNDYYQQHSTVPPVQSAALGMPRKDPMVDDLDEVMSQSSVQTTSRRTSFFRNSFMRASARPSALLSLGNRMSVDASPNKQSVMASQGKTDMEGWLHKQGDKYKTWNKRWFVLKGSNLFYFKSPKDSRVKAIINLVGYSVIADEKIHPGKYSFMARHERERTFYFYTDSEKNMRAWMRALMKATISRNFSAPVLSSSTVPTVSLDQARRMRPRPPSMLLHGGKDDTFGLESIMERPFSLREYNSPPMRTSLSDHTGQTFRAPLSRSDSTNSTMSTSGERLPPVPSISSPPVPHLHAGTYLDTVYDVPDEDDEDLIDPDRSMIPAHASTDSFIHDPPPSSKEDVPPVPSQPLPGQSPIHTNPPSAINTNTQSQPHLSQSILPPSPATTRPTSVDVHLEWANAYMAEPIRRLDDLRSGEVLILLLEGITGKTVRRAATNTPGSTSMQMLDNLVAAFRFMGREGVQVDGSYTIKDVFNGNQDKILLMLDAIKAWADNQPSASRNVKRYTFGGENNTATPADASDTS
ncbi:hypothetical protein BCR43DRAFT_461404 [Syncephalastrum racemosum]|uniref:PH domain-containing protein n=1 Tax=Syncephalastrum racemosum TaxID=13706 RepID=A0A1X2H688_SYNRA|nr:hypothetical protein BCR43DRAFT_461404 [Syncephalastrum racemosum]